MISPNGPAQYDGIKKTGDLDQTSAGGRVNLLQRWRTASELITPPSFIRLLQACNPHWLFS
jgi:hypothetical protein